MIFAVNGVIPSVPGWMTWSIRDWETQQMHGLVLPVVFLVLMIPFLSLLAPLFPQLYHCPPIANWYLVY